ncbi:calcium-binding protein, partial [Oharaeibacter diazotrophicus]
MTTVYDTRTTGKTIKGTGGDNNLMGTDYADRMYGYAGNDWLVGQGGDDLLIGGPGADILDGGLGSNTASFADAKSGVDANLYTRTGTLGDAAGDEYREIVHLTGSKFSDVLTGNPYSNILKGGAGNDKLYGLDGDDQLYVGIGTDLADGGTGTDLVSYLGVGRGVTVDLQTPSANKGEALGDSYVSIEDVGGTGYADVLYGS